MPDSLQPHGLQTPLCFTVSWSLLKLIPEYSLEGLTDAEAEAPTLWPPDAKNWLIRKGLDAGEDWRQEKGTREIEMVGWHYWHEFEQAPGDGEGQGALACCSPWGCKESDMTEQLNNDNMCIELVMPSNHLIVCGPLLSSLFPSIRVFSNESALHIRWLLILPEGTWPPRKLMCSPSLVPLTTRISLMRPAWGSPKSLVWRPANPLSCIEKAIFSLQQRGYTAASWISPSGSLHSPALLPSFCFMFYLNI